MNKWTFDEIKSGRYQGINDSGIETFNENIIKSLTREVIQNSLDANNEARTTPVKVSFNVREIEVIKLPGNFELIEALKMCVYEAKTREDSKAMGIFSEMVEYLSNATIQVLVASDYGTSGLSNVAAGGGTFESLVKSEGYSQKLSSSSGGSFGIGKNAAFSASKVRTVFYNTLNLEGERGFQGVTILTSHKSPQTGIMRLAKGFYPLDPIMESSNYFNNIIQRTEVGTDILICGFDSENFKENCIDTIVNNFMVAIEKKKLEVEVEGSIIDKSNYGKIIKDNHTKIRLGEKKMKRSEQQEYIHTIQFYNALKNTVHLKKIKFDDIDESIEVYITTQKDTELCREIIGSRRTGMFIHSFKRFRGAVNFSGVVYFEGEKINQLLKEMENPLHNKWEPSRYSGGITKGNKLISLIRKAITEVLEQYIEKEDDRSFQLSGLSLLANTTQEVNNKDIKLRVKNNIVLNSSSSSDTVNQMILAIEKIYGGLTPSEKNKLEINVNFKEASLKKVPRVMQVKDGGNYILDLKFKVKGNYHLDFVMKTLKGNHPLKIDRVELASGSGEVYKISDSQVVLVDVISGEYTLDIKSIIKYKAVVEVIVREIKK